MVAWLTPTLRSLQKSEFHGNIKWDPASLMSQALIWAWQDARDVTDAFSAAQVVCANLKLERVAKTYTTFLNALSRHADQFTPVLRQRLQVLMEEVAERRWRDGNWVRIAFDGSRTTTPRTVFNEKAFRAPNYGR